MKRQDAINHVLPWVRDARPQQVRAAVNSAVRKHMRDLVESRHPSSRDAWASVEREGRELGRWLSEQVGQEFNERVPSMAVKDLRVKTGGTT